MPSRFLDRLSKFGTRMKAVNSVEVTYSRSGVGDIAGIQASPLYTAQNEIFTGAAIVQVHCMDWGVDTADIVFNSQPSKPKHDDTITVTEAGHPLEGLVFRVVTRGNDNPYHFTTSNRDRMRIYSDRIA